VMTDGFKYTGGWKGGKFEGQGKATYVSGDIYEGMFSAGKRHGQGTMRYASGDVATGIWQAGALTETLTEQPEGTDSN